MVKMKGKMGRFDLNLPKETIEKIEKLADNLGIPPRTLGRTLLMEKVKELEEKAADL